MLFMIILSTIVIAALDTYKDIQKRDYRKLTVYYCLMAVSAVTSILTVLGFEVPSPARSIEHIVHGIMGI